MSQKARERLNPQSAAQRLLNPFDWYRHQRENAPVFYDADRHIWMVFGYEDVQRVLSEHATFSSEYGRGGGASDPLGASIISTDPPRHRQLRTLVTQAFTPRTVAQLEPRIQGIVDGLLDTVAGAGELDIIGDLAYPLPVIVIAELLGIPAEDRAQFKQWSDAVVTGTRAAGMAGRDPQAEMSAYFLRLIEERRREPRGDLISGLLAAQIEGEHLSQVELLGFCVLLLVAGNETTTNLIGNAILCLDEQPDALERLRAEPALLPGAIEEVLRYRSPVQFMFRATVREAEMGGQAIPAGRPVIAWIGSANRDPVQFPDPDRFDIARTPNRHLAFGQGIHFCLGAPLARLEARIALEALLQRARRIQVAPDARLDWLESTIVYGVKRLPVALTPA